MKWKVSITAVLLWILPGLALAGMTVSESYKLTVTIPETVGYRLPAANLTQASLKDSAQQIVITKETTRNHEMIVMKSFVTK